MGEKFPDEKDNLTPEQQVILDAEMKVLDIHTDALQNGTALEKIIENLPPAPRGRNIEPSIVDDDRLWEDAGRPTTEIRTTDIERTEPLPPEVKLSLNTKLRLFGDYMLRLIGIRKDYGPQEEEYEENDER